MKEANPFPSVSILLPDDIVEDNDATVASYWKKGDTCLLQISSFLREQGPQVSAAERLSQRIRAGGEYEAFDLPRQIEGCESAALQPPMAKALRGSTSTWSGDGSQFTLRFLGNIRRVTGHGMRFLAFGR